MIGKTLAHYEITSQIGKGGMGEVYQAKDTKLGRDVAIKVLPDEFARDADRVARFQREAKLLASLNHPNIAAIHGLEEADGAHFLVMELIEGNTLDGRIKAEPIPVEEALKLALQIAEALEAAHEKGVIHRDLKPANIKVTPDGKVKVLDFGLAKAFAGDQEAVNPLDSPTLSAAATRQGVILGTAAYMSPEQAKGKPVDKRTDIWAFGCVLYEMLTGQAALQGEDVTEILASVVKASVNLDLLPANIHPRVRELVSRCLQKELKKRYRDIGDVQFEIEQVLSDPNGILVQPVTAVKPRKKLRLGIPGVAVITTLGIIIAGVAVWYLKPTLPPEPKQVTRFEYELPEGQQFTYTANTPKSIIAISHDGRYLVYATPKGLYLHALDQLTAKLIAGTEGNVVQPFFSPDGTWIGYYADGQLKKIPISGGVLVTICSTQGIDMVGASWGEDNTIVYGQYPGDIMRVSANGGTPVSIIKTISAAAVLPHILPGGKSVLYTDSTGPAQGNIMVQSLGTGKPKELFAGIAVGYLPTGHIVYGLPDKDNLYAIPFDLNAMEVKGGSVPILEGVTGHGVNAAISDSGTLVYIPETSATANRRAFIWVDREGEEEPLGVAPNNYSDYFKISPDGTRVALCINTDGNYDIWIWNLARKTMTRFTFDIAIDHVPIWTPDSHRIIFSSLREPQREGIYWKAADGSGKVEKLASVPDRDMYPLSLPNDGKTLLLCESGGESGYDIGMLSMEGDRTPKLLLQEKHDEKWPQISPGGKWIAYQSNESGRFEVYVRSFPDVESGGRWQVSTNGGEFPLWSPNGKELFYRSLDAIMTVSVETDPTFKLGTPRSLFPNKYVGQFDISPDGKRFLMLKQAATDEKSKADAPRKIIIVLNWYGELKQKVPVD